MTAPVAAAPPHGTVLISGDAHRAWLLRGGRRYRAESIPPGSYQVQVIFTEGAAVVNAGSVEIASGATTRISCSAKFLRCSIQ